MRAARMPAVDGGRNETALCRLEEIEDGGAKGFRVEAHGLTHRLFAVRKAGRIYVYRNDCPHVGTPLDWAPDQFLDSRGESIVCATHGALFRIADGYCFAGPCVGASLEPVFFEVRGEVIYVPTEPLDAL